MGHASIQTTLDRYAHLLPETQRQAGERLDVLVFGRKERVPDSILIAIQAPTGNNRGQHYLTPKTINPGEDYLGYVNIAGPIALQDQDKILLKLPIRGELIEVEYVYEMGWMTAERYKRVFSQNDQYTVAAVEADVEAREAMGIPSGESGREHQPGEDGTERDGFPSTR